MENTGFTKKIYLVGGAIRDYLLGLPTKDKDYVAVGFSENDFQRYQKVGKNFPVFLIDSHTQIALARKETKTTKGYNGFSYKTDNVTLLEDLKRRDLSINAMALDLNSNTLIDPFNGKKDLQNKILRHTSPAFCEDPLRILRLARFKAKLGIHWKIHPSTKVLVHSMKEELKTLEPNRVFEEIKQVLSQKNSHLFFETLFELGVLKEIFPSIYALTILKEYNPNHLESSVFVHTMEVLKRLDNDSLLLKLTALYHNIAKPYTYRNSKNPNEYDNPKKVESLIDMQIPKTIQKKMLILIGNHIKITHLFAMHPSKILDFFHSFKGDKTLLLDQIRFFEADYKRCISQAQYTTLESKKIIELFSQINSYSPKEWIQSQKSKPNGNQIKDHIQKAKINLISSFLSTLSDKQSLRAKPDPNH
ncbi:polynucleotide adenylyltransferase [Helicobacter canadensis]|uniref:tRNA nucleotidyl transferase n=1 Tax=Helicobacter canadensis MIT 98-5491 TaxID=537970 RepID=C5ZY12_9HELI|nr:polynucleotide adenylyltransferase [Helicobacter canadensis]EES90030.1 tRNA nucleotidyl transferase [Helicobacter canadensis MIT 98-5491]EFR49180.1 putative multifunctional CCA protein [Helicobacter canadensis MIT 98-5491]STP02470.1 poly(A) polymerase [Helicobacter canadensis]